MSDITLFNQDGRILASSRDVAEKFGKRNPDVNRAIENLIVQNCTVSYFALLEKIQGLLI